MKVLLNVKLKNNHHLLSIDGTTYLTTGNKFSVCVDVKDVIKWIKPEEVKSIKIIKLYAI